jgi:uncharacterized protein (DUF1800 family)
MWSPAMTMRNQTVTAAAASDPKWAWAPYEPGRDRPWDLALAAQLLRRAGFAASWSDLQQALADGPQRTVDRLLRPQAGFEELERRLDTLEASLAVSESAASDDCAELWLYRMMQARHPLLEKMALFWHGYFAVAGAGVGKASLVQQHVRLLHRHALGRFDAMLRDVCRDPATLIARGARVNRKANPALEFAAALLGRYTLGAGAFGESDVREAARAFTGAAVVGDEYRYLSHEHDDGAKTVLGKQGNFDGEQVVRLLLAHPATPQFVVGRLYGWLISETEVPASALLAPLADSFGRDYDIARLADTMLRSNLFFSADAYRQRVKSPLEFALGIVGAFEASVAAAPLHRQLAGLGQQLLEPPTREGWPGSRRWLNRFTLVGRSNLAADLLAPQGSYAGKLDPQAVAAKHGSAEPARMSRFLLELLVQNDLPAEVAGELSHRAGDARQLVHAIVALPEFQLA